MVDIVPRKVSQPLVNETAELKCSLVSKLLTGDVGLQSYYLSLSDN